MNGLTSKKMQKRTAFIASVFLFLNTLAIAQTGVIRGTVKNAINNEALPTVTVLLQGTTIGVLTDFDGKYSIEKLKPGFYNVEFKFIGFKSKVVYEVQVTNSKPAIIDAELEEESKNIAEVEIKASTFYKPQESPVSLRTIGVSEIKRNPGGNRDISKVIQSLPGVASTVTFRNDIIIRGGAPNENKFYLDGIEIPNINHFATQGSTGGPVGLINVDFVKEVDFYSGAFPTNRGNALSSVFDFKFKEGRTDRVGASLTLGSSDLATVIEGPINKKTTFIASYRRSYLQFLFKALELSFLPEYNDFQFKVKTKIDDKNELTILGIGAIDDFSLNLDANETEDQKYQLQILPVFGQSNYTIGANYKRYRANGFSTLVISRNYLNNTTEKYPDNDETKPILLQYSSKEIENKLRLENTNLMKGYKLNYGISVESATYTNDTYNNTPFGIIDYASELNFFRYAFFAQSSKGYFKERLQLSLGLRADANTYSSRMNNLLEQLSPRFSASYAINDKISVNGNVGKYYQTPAYTVLGYRNTAGDLVNTNVKYISNNQSVLGIEYNTLSNLRFTLEGFYKVYENYPMIVTNGDTIPLANLGTDFGVVGDKPVAALTKGRSYGLEFLAQQKLQKGFYGIVAFTLVRSEFQNKREEYIASSWDNRYILSLTGGKIFKKNWEVGAKLRFSGGAPYTPIDLANSSTITNYDLNPQGSLDYTQLNANRLGTFYQLDVRVDKKYNFKNVAFNIFLDIQNLTGFVYQLQPNFLLDRDANGNAQIDPADPSKYKTKLIDNPIGNTLPAIGLILEW
jgi:TonB dependent receptor/CarboxypepD_reg-like domain/TonB-dependent Receptor Plug Domain